ncbi:MAG: FAD-dependent monooxygenase [Amaricoccus sp.]|uniref:FAD-dependent monooxygenase n=1 Tax=Amaricoccus sp. TaxID=1872485 RepID=UPI003314BA2D
MASVLIVGGGPVGLTLALALARAKVAVRIIDKAAEPSRFCRAIGVTPRTLEVMEDLGPTRDLIEAGLWLTGMRVVITGDPARDVAVNFSDLPYSALGVPQYATEAVLGDHLARHGVLVERGVALTGLDQDADGVNVTLDTPAGPETARYPWVVGCDGAHSTVRRALGLGFEGDAFPMEFMLGDVAMDWDLPRGMTYRAITPRENAPPDLFVAIPLPDRDRYRVTMVAPDRLSAPAGAGTDHGIQSERPDATIEDLREVAARLVPGSVTLSDMRWSSIFRISMRLASGYRVGRALIAGDAAHIHPPTGGQGMNTGIQDAYNLAWKLGMVISGRADATLLDSYEAERRPVAAEVVARTTEASVNLGHPTHKPNRLEDTQILVSYAGGPLAEGPGTATLKAGDRAPDVPGLRRFGVGFPLRLFDFLKGPDWVLLAPVDEDTMAIEAAATALGPTVRVIGVSPAAPGAQPPRVTLAHDADGGFMAAYGATGAWLIRPDKYIGLHLPELSVEAVRAYLSARIGLGA